MNEPRRQQRPKPAYRPANPTHKGTQGNGSSGMSAKGTVGSGSTGGNLAKGAQGQCK